MPSATELEGKYVSFKLDPGGTATPDQRKLFAQGQRVLEGQVTPQNVKVYTAASDAGPFTAAAVPWNFNFLKYIAGGITTTGLTTAVMTGPMSGCYLITYTEGVQRCLAHVGTVNTPDDPDTVGVKDAWKAMVGNITGVAGASPAKLVSFGDMQKGMPKPDLQRGPPQLVGYFAAGEAYAMVLAPIKGSQPGDLMKVTKVKKMPLSPWSSLSQLREFA